MVPNEFERKALGEAGVHPPTKRGKPGSVGLRTSAAGTARSQRDYKCVFNLRPFGEARVQLATKRGKLDYRVLQTSAPGTAPSQR